MKRNIGVELAAQKLKLKIQSGRASAHLINKILRESYRTHARDRASRMAVKRCLG